MPTTPQQARLLELISCLARRFCGLVKHLFLGPPPQPYAKIALSSASTSPSPTSPPAALAALLTARTAASLPILLLSRASCSRRALVFELPLGATSLSSFTESLGVKFTKSITPNPPAPVGVFGVRGGRGGLLGGALWWF